MSFRTRMYIRNGQHQHYLCVLVDIAILRRLYYTLPEQWSFLYGLVQHAILALCMPEVAEANLVLQTT